MNNRLEPWGGFSCCPFEHRCEESYTIFHTLHAYKVCIGTQTVWKQTQWLSEISYAIRSFEKSRWRTQKTWLHMTQCADYREYMCGLEPAAWVNDSSHGVIREVPLPSTKYVLTFLLYFFSSSQRVVQSVHGEPPDKGHVCCCCRSFVVLFHP